MNSDKNEKSRRFVKLSLGQISKILKKEKASELKLAIKILKEATDLSSDELLNLLISDKEECLIPISLFQNRKLGSLQILVKYLKENLGFNFSNISKLLNRDQRTIWSSYNNASKKFTDNIILKDVSIKIPISKFTNRKLSTLEVIVDYLKFDLNLNNSEISRLINRDSRTIYTVSIRIKEKNIGNT